MKQSLRLVAAGMLVVLAAACGSGTTKSAPPSPTTGSAKAADVPGVGTGVTDTEIKLGVSLLDFKCIPAKYVSSIYVDQPQAYNAFIDNINEHGGINGRLIKPYFHTICPVQPNAALTSCTTFTDDDQVFAVVGSMYDPTGDSQLCVARQHKTVLITDGLSQDMIDKAPPGFLLSPGITSDRRLKVVMGLVKSRHILDGKKVAVLSATTATAQVDSVVDPILKSIGVEQGSRAVLQISGLDTTTPQTQLQSFLEKWKIEHVNALILVGPDASSQDFVNKIKSEIPEMQLIADTTSVAESGQADVVAGIKPNPYDGIITAEGRIHLEHSQTKNYAYCRDIFEKQTGIKIPLPNVVVKLPSGQQNDIYGNAEDACSYVTMFQDIAEHIGKHLNNANWTSTVNDLGPVKVMNTDFATLHAGKYDADDTFGLVAFDPGIAPKGDWRHVTPTENVG